MATKTLTTRIALKTDTTENWAASTLVLLKGEQAIEIPKSGEYKIKIGDGVNTFKDLPYVAMTPTEIKNLINSGAVQTVSLSSGTNNGTVKLTVDGVATDNIAVKGLGSAAYTNSNAYATAGHGHSISGVSGLQAALDGKSAIGHTHDDRYYTESEMNTKLAGKANASHTHGSGDITSLDASKLTGTINIDRLPAGALERCMIVADDTARFKLTTADVQKGDTVKVTATGKMYFVIDDSKLSTEDGYTVYTAGTATSVPWSGVTGKPSTFTPSAHKHTKSDITDFPASLKNPNSVTVTLNGGTTEGTNKFTYDGSAAKTINITPGNIGAAAASHGTHVTYSSDAPKANGTASAGSSGAVARADHVHPLQTTVSGNAGSATKLQTARKIGNASFDGSADITLSQIGAAASSHSHSIANITNLQSTLNAKAENSTLTNQDLNNVTIPGFYTAAGGNTCTNKPSNIDNFGLIVIHRAGGAYYTQICFVDNASYRRCNNNGTWTAWVQDKLTDTNTWRGVQNNLTSDATDQSLSAAQGKALKALVDGKAAAGHTHTEFTQETHFSTGTYTDPAADILCAVKVSGNLAATTLYEGTTKLSDKYQAKGSYAASSHTHTIAQITNLQTTLDGKSNNGHSHAISSVTGLQDALNGKAASSHTHTIANVTGLQAALDGKSNTNHGHTSITTYGVNTIGKVADDTTANWASKNNSIHFYQTDKLLNGQPSQYGFLFNMAQGGSELHQIWAAGGGSLYHRYGNASGIETTWREVLDSSSYTNYTVTKGGSGATGTWGISITGNAATSSSCTGNAATATVANSAKACTGNSATATKLATARKIGNASFDGSADITLSAIGAASSGHTHNYAGSGSAGGAANSAVKLSTARAFSITGGATAAAIDFNGTGNVALNVTSVSTDVLNNGSNTLILSCGGAA